MNGQCLYLALHERQFPLYANLLHCTHTLALALTLFIIIHCTTASATAPGNCGMVICLECGANDLHMVQLMPLPSIISCFSKIQNGLPSWCWLTQVVLEKSR